MDEGFNGFGLNRFGGAPGGGPGISIEARGRFFGTCLFGIARGTNFFGMRIWGFGFGLMRFELAASFAPRFRFACFFFGIITSSYSESSSSESSSSLKVSRSGGLSFFHRLSGRTFFMSKDPFFPQTCRSNKRTGINRRLLWPTWCARWTRTDGICNYSWFTNRRFSQFQLPRFHNGFQFNCHFGLRLAFGLDTLYYPLQHRPRFRLRLFMLFHVRLKCACVPTTLETPGTFKLLFWHLGSQKRTANDALKNKKLRTGYVKPTRLHDCGMFHSQKHVS